MNYTDDFDRAKTLSAQSIAFLDQHHLALHPVNYEVVYAYHARSIQQITIAIKKLLEDQTELTDLVLSELHYHYLSPKKQEEEIEKASNHVVDTIEDVQKIVNDTQSTSHEYRSRLIKISSQIEGKDNLEVLRQEVHLVLKSTDLMIKQNEMLEKQLHQSAALMEELQKNLEQVKKEAMTDSLTNVSNRKAFDLEIERLHKESKIENRIFSLIMIDIDHFKKFNDDYGHLVGDQVLTLVAKTLLQSLKGKDIVARFGGEEFAILLPDTTYNVAHIVANSVREAIAKKEIINRTSGQNMGRVTISAGIAELRQNDDIIQIIERADRALYEAKKSGRNCVQGVL